MTEVGEQARRFISLEIQVPCDIAETRPATLQVRTFLSEQGVTGDDLVACELALAEACNNAINYCEPGRRCDPVGVQAICRLLEVELRVTDHTAGFEWPEQAPLPEQVSERGRGLFLIQSLMTGAEYLRGVRENCLVMRRRIGSTARPGAWTPAGDSQTLNRRLAEAERVIAGMADELGSCYESLAAIFRYGSEQGRSLGLEAFSKRLLDDLLQITLADWFVLRLMNEAGTELRVFSASNPELWLSPLRWEDGPAGPVGSLEIEAARLRQDVWFEPRGALRPSDPLGEVRAGSVGLVHPIYFGDTLIGTLAVGKEAEQLQFTAAKINVVQTFCDFLCIQIMNARFHDERVRTLVVARELEIARNIQRSLLLKSVPTLPGFGLAAYCESAREVGGDFYDVIPIPPKGLLLVIADVMGKGIPAAMFAAILRSLVRALPHVAERPAELLARLNRLLFGDLSEVEMFITAQLAYVDGARSRLVTASAGHCPLLLVSAGQARWISPEGMPLGILEDAMFEDEEHVLAAGRTAVLMYTDGLTEARDDGGGMFGQERLARWLERRAGSPGGAEAMRADLAALLAGHQGGRALNDDQTFLILNH